MVYKQSFWEKVGVVLVLFTVVVLAVGVSLMGYEAYFIGYVLQVQPVVDLNGLSQEHFVLAQNQGLIIQSMQSQALCGSGQFVPDSNRLNEVPRGVIYSCFVAIEETT